MKRPLKLYNFLSKYYILLHNLISYHIIYRKSSLRLSVSALGADWSQRAAASASPSACQSLIAAVRIYHLNGIWMDLGAKRCAEIRVDLTSGSICAKPRAIPKAGACCAACSLRLNDVYIVREYMNYIYGPGLQAPPPTPPPQRVWVHRFLYVGGTSGLPPAPPVGGWGVSVCTCMYGCMYVCICM